MTTLASALSVNNDSDDNEEGKDTLSMKTEWRRIGNEFHSQDRADKLENLPNGIYEFVPTMTGWFLSKTGHNFEFPFKVYNASSEILDRIIRHWIVNGGNLGILMNGLRGAGKTMTAQLLANRLIEEHNLPVLVVRNPIPLDAVLNATQQDLMVIFDEFEKSHEPKHQQALLTTIDGMSRSEYNRLFVFTTNSPAINENFRDRPSRIHYQFEFQKIADEVIEGLIQDWLPEDLMHFKGEIFEFLHSRSLCTIDIVKAVLTEVKIFRESPREFEAILNISKGEPPSFCVTILDPGSNDAKIRDFDPYFRLNVASDRWSSLLLGNRRSVDEFTGNRKPVQVDSDAGYGYYSIRLLEKCAEENCWLAELGMPYSQTFYSKFEDCYDNGNLWLDARPADWDFPFTPEMVKKNKKASATLENLYNQVARTHTLYGTGQRAAFKIRITPNKKMLSNWKVFGGGLQGLQDFVPRAAPDSGSLSEED